jgi:POT family proton-dependent oligopeptide transporter
MSATGSAAQKAWFGHPRGLTILALTEMWSSFCYFGMRALLIYYMTKELLMSQEISSIVYGTYSSIAFFTPILGGIISDRWLGRKRAVVLGGIVMAAGSFMMAAPTLLYPALCTIAIGNGLFLPSLSSQINALYEDGDPRKESAYNIYYAFINFGAVLAPLISGTIGEMFGWRWGFVVTGIGMAAGLAVYLGGARHLPPEPRNRLPAAADAPSQARMHARVVWLLAAVFLFVVVFRAAYEQAGNTIALWADTGVDRKIGDWSIPMTWFQSLNPAFIFIFTPVIVAWWTRRARQGKDQSTVTKMGTGALIMAASYLMLAVIAGLAGSSASWLWLVFFFLVYTIGELFILPVGLGLFGRLAPPGHAATMIAAWFAASFFGNLAAGALGTVWSALSPPVFFVVVAGVATFSGISLLVLGPWARKLEIGDERSMATLDSQER